MRIQHNVTALNAYRNLRGNNVNLAKNLEKLSSGYRINRAGDDAAGLAVSEKMRAQITGLDAATKNAQDGISLVQTAEGALTEVHSMLNRMVTLATQSANGTYDNEVDRANLQKEVASLKTEIDRISESSNYNGIKLLDGSLANGAALSKLPNVTVNGVTGDANASAATKDVIEVYDAGMYKFKGGFNVAEGTTNNKFAAAGDTVRFQVKFNDEGGAERKIDVVLVAKDDSGLKIDGTKSTVKLDGKKVDITFSSKIVDASAAAINANPTKSSLTAELGDILGQVKGFKEIFKVELGSAADTPIVNTANHDAGKFLVITAKDDVNPKAEVKSILTNSDYAHSSSTANNTLKDVSLTHVAERKRSSITVHGAKMFSMGNDPTKLTDEDIKEATIEVNGEKFIFVNSAAKGDQALMDVIKKHGIREQNIIYSFDKGSPSTDELAMAAEDALAMANRINEAMGEDIAIAKGTDIIFEGKDSLATKDGLTLQIGDTAEKFNKMSVSIDSMSAIGLKITDVDVSTQENASVSILKIKNAINSVSSTRGDLGALQNRLEHTINNLGVMHENITEAESRIRDTDMAKEMMAYAKNNILVQSANAMLAQANQLPQSVLQLLQ